jgi:lipopolysaccharide export system protein LptA
MIRSPGPIRALAAMIVAIACGHASAERADRYQPTQIEADRMEYDDQGQVNVFTGNVVLTRGTIMIRGDRMVLRQDPEGFQYGTTTGKPATFRQKRDGVEEWIEGHGQELQYDGRNETVRLIRDARVRRTEGSRVADEIEGGLIVYDTRTERFVAEGGATPTATGRVRVTIQPRVAEPAPAAGARPPAGAPLQPAQRLTSPRAADSR